jgi:hypothetical protein
MNVRGLLRYQVWCSQLNAGTLAVATWRRFRAKTWHLLNANEIGARMDRKARAGAFVGFIIITSLVGCMGGDDVVAGESRDAAEDSDASAAADRIPDNGAERTSEPNEDVDGAVLDGNASENDGAPDTSEDGRMNDGAVADVGFDAPRDDSVNDAASESDVTMTRDASADAQPDASTANDGASPEGGATDGGSNGICGCYPGYAICPIVPGIPGLFRCCEGSLPNEPCKGCSFPHGVVACTSSSGTCELSSCLAGWSDCDHDPTNGCETDVTRPANCGTCGHSCANGEKCSNGSCVQSCTLAQADCSGSCADLSSSPQHCGDCAVSCNDCRNGACDNTPPPFSTCPSGFTYCRGACVDLMTDHLFCGSCANACPDSYDGSGCVAGKCVCPAELTNVGSACRDTRSDPQGCGPSFAVCSGGSYCHDGQCVKPSDQILVAANTDDMAIDDDFVYFLSTAGGTVSRVSKAGGSPTPLATGQPQPVRLAVDTQFVYFTNQLGAVMRMSKTGGDAAPFAAGNKPRGIALDSDTVYYANTGTKQILSAKKADGAPGVVASLDAIATELIYDGTVLDFVTGARPSEPMYAQWHLAWVSPAGGAVTWTDGLIPFCGNCCAQPQQLAGDMDNVYWPCSPVPGVPGYIYARNKATARLFVAFQGVTAVAVEPGGLYGADSNRLLGQLSCSDEIVDRPIGAQQILIDRSSIFVRNGSIYKMPK